MKKLHISCVVLLGLSFFLASEGWSKTKQPKDESTEANSAAPAKAASEPTTKTSKPAVVVPKEKRNVSKETKDKVYNQAGIPKQERKNYVIDHKVPLELGGSNAASNLQPQTKAQAANKDQWENYLTAQVKAGKMSLAEAQAEIQKPHSGPPPIH